MKETRINAMIAIATVVGAVIMLLALSFAIGKWSLSSHHRELIIKFPNASGINANSEVKFAGAPVGTVRQVRLIPRANQTIDPLTRDYNCVEVVAEIDPNLEVGDDVKVTIKQDGLGIAAKYILLTPGPDHDSKDLADGAEVQGIPPFELTDLLQPAGEALTQAKNLVTSLGPILDRLDSLSQNLQAKLPPLMNHADKLIQDGDGLLGNFTSPSGHQRLVDMLDSLQVSTENLKVVSTNAKALTATLAQKPWRVFWGGSTITPPSEAEVLKSHKVIPLKPDVDVRSSRTVPDDTVQEKPSP
jgi:ABC-type transporter Mla subunit MlaD